MGMPETPDDIFQVQQEIKGMQFSWQQLGELLAVQKRNDTEPHHPPAALLGFITQLRMTGMIPPPLEGADPELTWKRDLSIMINWFRFAQMCYRNNVKFDKLLACKCAAPPSKDEWSEFSDWLAGQS
jgi:hypothetical protein